MSERNDLLVSIADTIKTYESESVDLSSEHVDRWISQFSADQQLPFMREFDHVIKRSFITRKWIISFLRGLVTNKKLASTPVAYWAAAHFLDIQQNGNSQNEMLQLFAECLMDECNLVLDECGEPEGDYIYLDDVMFSGSRVGNDLAQWITRNAPQTATIHVIVAALHTSGHYLVEKKLKDTIKTTGKNIKIKFWCSQTIENRKAYKNKSNVLWPATIPQVEAVQTYLSLPSKFPFEPRQPGVLVTPFLSESGRQVLESEFLIAGAKIRSLSENPKPVMRPLGFSPFGIGFGSTIVTYRNCPNNCPLALWWGDPEATSGALHWYPLLPRTGYS